MALLKYWQAINKALEEELERDERVFIIGIDVGDPGGPFLTSRGLKKKFGAERVRDTPITEAGFVGLAIGAAAAGGRPVVDLMFSNFSYLAMSQLINEAAKIPLISNAQIKLPITVRILEGGGHFGSGAQHSDVVHGIFCNIPGLVVVCASTPYDAKGLLKAAIRDDRPVIFCEHLALYRDVGEVPDEDYVLPLGKAEIVRKGRDVTVIATQLMLKYSLEVSEKLSKEGIEVEIVNPRTLNPLDIETIASSVKKTGRVVIVDETPTSYGTQAGMLAKIMEHCFYDIENFKIVGSLDLPIPSGRVGREVLPSKEAIEKAIRSVL
jgi:pyruvate/2-oxoglutarate/acetoin dehydrogenase E1 component